MKRIIVIGGGISGLVCANVFRKRGADVEVFEPNEVGGEFLTGGLKYIHHTDLVENFFDDNKVIWGDYKVKGGILLRGAVRPYPKFLNCISKDDAIRIQNDHYRKTRKMEPGAFGVTAMNEPANAKSRKALRCDFPELIKRLASGVKITKSSLNKVISNKAFFSNGRSFEFDGLILTIPLWIIKRIVDFQVPGAVAMNLSIAIVKSVRDLYANWDYVYTPYTPSNCVHRISHDDEGYAVEVSGELDERDLHSDLNFLFKDGWYMKRLRTNLKGHLLPIEGEIITPNNVALVGRFAAWEPRMTVDVTLERAYELCTRWM